MIVTLAEFEHPPLVFVTVYVPAVVTFIDGVVAPVLHNNDPVAVVDNMEYPQLLTTVTTGADGIANGAAIPEPEVLVHPPTVLVTEYVPAVVIVIDEVVAPVFHNKDPEAVVDNTELPQLLATVTTGADGIAKGAAVPNPGALVHPGPHVVKVRVTLYVPAVVTVIDEVVAPVLHNKTPVAVVDNTE